MSFKKPISSLVLIYTEDFKVLLMERADKKAFWQSVTGSLEENETPIEAAAREVFEETGVNTNQYLLEDWHLSHVYEIYAHWRYRYAPNITHNTEHIFGLKLPSIIPIQLSEHVQYLWVDWKEAMDKVFSWTNVEAIKKLAEIHQLKL
ncbi:MutT NTP pyrophosphohydrolases including oxidative damage repair enzymes [Candidatus Methylopumilus universalis]|uniref:dihydroneopterin triphosphate diphosphatase n=1 Tax=Candidatus Methylopumilus universalis TaxID=2588536 RepID=UPI003BEF1C99